MTAVKTTINISEEVWEEFKRTVNSMYGGARSLSQVVEEAIRSYNVVEMLRESEEDLGVEIGGYSSGSEVEARRPTVSGSSAKILREMRGAREARILGQKRRCEEIPWRRSRGASTISTGRWSPRG